MNEVLLIEILKVLQRGESTVPYTIMLEIENMDGLKHISREEFSEGWKTVVNRDFVAPFNNPVKNNVREWKLNPNKDGIGYYSGILEAKNEEVNNRVIKNAKEMKAKFSENLELLLHQNPYMPVDIMPLVMEHIEGEDKSTQQTFKLSVKTMIEGWQEAGYIDISMEGLSNISWIKPTAFETEIPIVIVRTLPPFEDWYLRKHKPVSSTTHNDYSVKVEGGISGAFATGNGNALVNQPSVSINYPAIIKEKDEKIDDLDRKLKQADLDLKLLEIKKSKNEKLYAGIAFIGGAIITNVKDIWHLVKQWLHI